MNSIFHILFSLMALLIKIHYSSSLPDHEWEMEQLYTKADEKFFEEGIFPAIQQCRKAHDILAAQAKLEQYEENPGTGIDKEHLHKGPSLLSWSPLLSQILFQRHSGFEEDAEYVRIQEAFWTDKHYMAAFFGVPIIICLLIVFTIAGFVLVPIVGGFFFHISYLIFLIFYSIIRKIRKLFKHTSNSQEQVPTK